MSDTESSADERPSFTGAGLGANRRTFMKSEQEERGESPAKKMRFTKQSKPTKNGDAAPAYSKAGSFASRMMSKMGYKDGEGLGKEGKGRLAPIETQLRPQGAGLGAVKEKTKQAKEEEKREAAFRGEKIEDSSEEEREKRKQQRIKRPGVSSGPSYQKPKIKYRTVQEIEQESKGLEVPDVLKTLIDVSGNKTELLATGVLAVEDTEEAKIARRARRDLEVYAEDWRGLQERKKYYNNEFERHMREIDHVQDRARNLKNMLLEVERLAEMNTQQSPFDTVAETLQLFETRLQLNNDSDFQETLTAGSLDIQEITVAALAPSFTRLMSEWEPLETENPQDIIQHLAGLKEYLGLQENLALVDADGVPVIHNKRKNGSVYDSLINTYWLPVVRNAIINKWKVEDPEPMTKIVEAWSDLLPPFVASIVMNQLIIPRISEAIKKWRHGHKREGEKGFIRAAPDVFLFPWLPLLPAHHLNPQASSSLLADLRRKFAQEFGKFDVTHGPPPWSFPWSHVKAFKSTLSSLFTNHLVPRLAQYIDNIDYEPTEDRKTKLEAGVDWPLRCLSEWHKVLGDTTISHLLSAHFFPRLTKATYRWLITEPAVHEVGNFMRFWQRPMGDELQRLPIVHQEWTRYFAMVKQAFALGDRVAQELPPPEELKELNSRDDDAISDVADAIDLEDEPIEQTFRDIVEIWCEEYDLMLIPLHSAHTATGLPLFRITASASGRGGVQVYLKGDVVWAQNPKEKGKFVPMELGVQLAAWGGAKS